MTPSLVLIRVYSTLSFPLSVLVSIDKLTVVVIWGRSGVNLAFLVLTLALPVVSAVWLIGTPKCSSVTFV